MTVGGTQVRLSPLSRPLLGMVLPFCFNNVFLPLVGVTFFESLLCPQPMNPSLSDNNDLAEFVLLLDNKDLDELVLFPDNVLKIDI